jgi:hypothetical protein
VSCISPAPIGCTVICVCSIDRAGNGLQFASCNIYKEEDDDDNKSSEEEDVEEGVIITMTKRVLVAKGFHTRYVLKSKRSKL